MAAEWLKHLILVSDISPISLKYSILALLLAISCRTFPSELRKITATAGGFLYYVSITGVTGTKQADTDQVKSHIDQIRKCTDMPIAVGFGIKTPQDVSVMSEIGDAVVVGSVIVDAMGQIQSGSNTVQDVHDMIRALKSPLQ